MGDIVNNHTGSITSSDSGAQVFSPETFAGEKQDTFIGVAEKKLMAGKSNTNKSFIIENGKLKQDKQETVINQYNTTLITKTKMNVINAKITMVG
jgi:hypothetical protein